jgi:heat shock protein HtpX
VLVAGHVLVNFGILLILGLVAGLGVLAWLIAGVLSAALTAAVYLRSDALVLRLSRARPATAAEYPRFHNLVEGIGVADGLPKPRLYVIDDEAPNALVTGRNVRAASLVVTTGLLEGLTRVEMEGVLAQELCRIKNGEARLGTLAVVMAGGPGILADLGVRGRHWNGGRHGRDDPPTPSGAGATLASAGSIFLPLMPAVGRGMQILLGKQRQQLADLRAVQVTRFPPGLIAAFEKLDQDDTVTHAACRTTAHLWLCQPLAQNDQEGQFVRFNRNFVTHPPMEERIAALREL